MFTGTKKIQAKLKSVDCIVEVHDARVLLLISFLVNPFLFSVIYFFSSSQIPISGRNPNFKRDFLGVKPHILVLNKSDLADVHRKPEVLQYLNSVENIHDVVFTDCKHQNSSVGLPEVSWYLFSKNCHFIQINFLSSFLCLVLTFHLKAGL